MQTVTYQKHSLNIVPNKKSTILTKKISVNLQNKKIMEIYKDPLRKLNLQMRNYLTIGAASNPKIVTFILKIQMFTQLPKRGLSFSHKFQRLNKLHVFVETTWSFLCLMIFRLIKPAYALFRTQVQRKFKIYPANSIHTIIM